MAFILTEWAQIEELDLNIYIGKMKQSIVFDGRNCYSLNKVQKYLIEYHSIDRKPIYNYQFQTV